VKRSLAVLVLASCGGGVAVEDRQSAFGTVLGEVSGAWQEVTPRSGNMPAGGRLAYDSDRHRLLMLAAKEVWQWTGSEWLLVAMPPLGPTAMDLAFYHPGRKTVVTYGGALENNSAADETWEFDGAQWINRTRSDAKPPPLANTAMAWDGVNGTVVMFGGFERPNLLAPVYTRAVLWQWDGESGRWAPIDPASGDHPSQRAAHGMVWDEARGRVVVFGTRPMDVWEWDPAARTWTERAVMGAPDRFGYKTIYDPTRTLALLVGDSMASPDIGLVSWDGASGLFAPISMEGGRRPPSRWLAECAFDRGRGRLVVRGGYGTGGEPRTDLWELRLASTDGGVAPDGGRDGGAMVSPGDAGDAGATGDRPSPADAPPDGGPPTGGTGGTAAKARRGAYEGTACSAGGRPGGPGTFVLTILAVVAIWRGRRRT
jgi:MYXO-CTERM domain-containing protein